MNVTVGEANPTFGLEGEVAELADVRPDVGVRADVLLQHAGLLAADATLLADVLPPAAAAHVHVVLVGLVPAGEREGVNAHYTL